MRISRLAPAVACVLAIGLFLCRVPAEAQAIPRRGLVPNLGVTSTTSTGGTGSTAGLRAGLLSLRPTGIGFDFGLAWLVPSRTSEVFRRYGAVSTDLGLVHVLSGGAADLLLGAGGSFLLNGNGTGDAAPHLKLGVLRAVSDRVGIRGDLVGRYWFHGPGLGVGLDAGLLWLPGPFASSTQPPSRGSSFDGWIFGAAANLLAVSQETWDLTFRGPAVAVARVQPHGVGFETALTFIMPTGRYDFTGASLDLGLAYGLPAGASSLLLLRLGGTALVGGDSDGSGGGAGAIYPGAAWLQRLSGRLAFRLDLTPRIWIGEQSSMTFGGSAGLSFTR